MRRVYFIGVVILAALLFRILWLPENLFFGFEQGRDLLVVQDIASFNEIKLIGPNTDIDGIYHGALSYYLLVPFFWLTGGNPLSMLVSLILVNVAGIYLLFRAVENLFNRNTALLASLFYAVSYSAIVYSRWLSNPNLIPVLTIVIFYSLVQSRKNKWFIPFGALSWGILFHLSLATAATLILPILLSLWLLRVQISLKVILVSVIFVFMLFLPYVTFELKNNFILMSSLQSFLNGMPHDIDRWGAIDQFSNELVDNFFPLNRRVALSLFLVVLVSTGWFLKGKNERWIPLAFLLFPVLFFILVGIRPLRHVYIALPVFFSIVSALVVDGFFKKRLAYVGSFLLVGIITGNLLAVFVNLPQSKANFLQHAQRTYLGDEKRLIDYIYQDAEGLSFSYDYYSIPYWKEEGWKYLFLWYGQERYGYVPSVNRTDVFYVLIEPDETQPLYQKDWYENMNKEYLLVSSFSSRKLTVEKRKHK